MAGSSASGEFQYAKLEHGLVFVMLCGMVIFLARVVRAFQQRGMTDASAEDDADGIVDEESEGDEDVDERHSD